MKKSQIAGHLSRATQICLEFDARANDVGSAFARLELAMRLSEVEMECDELRRKLERVLCREEGPTE